ncbi:hypothetical protein FRC08_008457 [Ceratobasidium sp. 394]|nr:hypothetical protein FRC08_008457 [Ceratobasidium sp. 394]KAG9076817.1 hypothetical protein FS749_011356 [Ceratobasidium sp. UAMH 11750]
MKTYRHKLRAQSGAYKLDVNPADGRQKAATRYYNLASNPEATIEDLRDALLKATSMLEGSEARSALLSSELAAAQDTLYAQKKRATRAGRVGKSRVYTQAEIDAEVEQKREAEEA